ncbi:putative 2-dehydropantoate 2-reductase [Mangrovibacterium sp.]|uniref:putative 2-dehydropantoate 2-reductase n=1 Tax=Mangrovibacterium sp. TaxID=1961364 RepID=UPI003564B7BB
MSLNYAVVGTGALGGYYGSKLARSGKSVHFLLNSDFEYVKQHGLRIESVQGNFNLNDVQAYRSATEMPKVDVVLVCLKTTNNYLLEELLPPLLHSASLVILIQNGLGVESKLAEQFPNLQIAGGLAFICSNKTAPGHIRHLDLGKLILGSFNLTDLKVLQQVVSDFQDAEVPCQFAEDLYFARWQKLVWNVPFNGLAVVLNSTTDRIMAQEESRRLAQEIMYEIVDGAIACGVNLSHEYADEMLAMTAKMPPYAPSMKLDFDLKRPMEVHAIYSEPINDAASNGFEMKKVAVLEKQLHFYNTKRR